MILTTRRVLSASLPLAILAGATLAANATPVVRGAAKPAVTVNSIRPNAVAVSAYGGGATFPIPAYVGVDLSSGSTTQGATGSVFGYLFPGLTYCATGSGKAKTVFTGPIGSVTNPCANAGTATPPYGFSAPAGTKIAALTGSDAPLSSSDYSTYQSSVSSLTKEPVELPSIVGSIAVVYNEPSCPNLTLTESQIAKIFNGQYTSWNQVSASCGNVAIIPSYRSDGSGTSFIFSNTLATNTANDATVTTKINGNSQFVANSGAPATGAVPFAAIPIAGAAKGNNGVYTFVQANAHSVGYVETGFVVTHPSTATRSALVINPNTKTAQDSVKNLPEASTSVTYANDAVDSVVLFGSGPAKVQTLASQGITPPVAGCVQLVNPASFSNPAKGYPIVGVTYLLAAYQGNGTLSTTIANAFNGLYTPTNFGTNIKTVDPASKSSGTGTRGYSGLGTSFNSNLKAAVKNCIHA